MKSAFVTGVTGQDGSYLAELLIAKDYEVWGLSRPDSASETTFLDRFSDDFDSGALHLVNGDITDHQIISEIITEIAPDEIYNLAAQSFLPDNIANPKHAAEVNGFAAVGILDTIRSNDLAARYFQASSSEIFGQPASSPQTEMTRIRPRNPYGRAKAYGFWNVADYRQNHGVYACSGILYTHESPRRPQQFVTRKITSSAVRIKLGLQDELFLGNLDAGKDWGYAGDYVEAMWKMLQGQEPDDYVIATGEVHTVREFLTEVFEFLELDWKDYVKIDKRFFRPIETSVMVGDPDKANRQLDWSAKTSFKELARLMTQADMEEMEAVID